jgi:hypothetical protein
MMGGDYSSLIWSPLGKNGENNGTKITYNAHGTLHVDMQTAFQGKEKGSRFEWSFRMGLQHTEGDFTDGSVGRLCLLRDDTSVIRFLHDTC